MCGRGNCNLQGVDDVIVILESADNTVGIVFPAHVCRYVDDVNIILEVERR